MKTRKIQLTAGTIIELSFATIIEGKEKQLFGEYFPKVTPIVNNLGGTPLCSFAINDSASKPGKPGLGALFQWPDMDAFYQLHSDPEFLAIKSIRDESLSFFSNGHFFKVDQDTEINFEEDQFYSLVRSWHKTENETPKSVNALAHMFSVASPENSCDCLSHVVIKPWDDHSEALPMESTEQEKCRPEIFKFKMNFPPQ